MNLDDLYEVHVYLYVCARVQVVKLGRGCESGGESLRGWEERAV